MKRRDSPKGIYPRRGRNSPRHLAKVRARSTAYYCATFDSIEEAKAAYRADLLRYLGIELDVAVESEGEA